MKKIFTFLIIIAFHLQSSAQIFIGSNFKVSQETTVYFSGDFINSSNGSVINQGDMQVEGNWTNNGQFDESDGTVSFVSSSSQNIDHNSGTLFNVVLDGGGDKVLLSDLTISNQVEFINGIIVSSQSNPLSLIGSAIHSGANDLSHVLGPVVYLNANTTTVEFPVGDGSTYLPVRLIEISSGEQSIGFELIDMAAGGSTADTVLSYSNLRYWQMYFTEQLPVARIELPLIDESLENDQAQKFIVVGAQNSSAEFGSLGGAVNGDFVTSELLINGRAYAIGKEELFPLIISNYISNNSDGINDFIQITNSDKYEGLQVIVINRLGNIVVDVSANSQELEILTQLDPGNYICVIKRDGKELAREVITVTR